MKCSKKNQFYVHIITMSRHDWGRLVRDTEVTVALVHRFGSFFSFFPHPFKFHFALSVLILDVLQKL